MNAGDAAGFNAPEPAEAEREGYLDKLVKYLPAEVTAVASAFFAAFDVDGWGVWIAMAVLAVVNVAYLGVNALATKTQPQWYFYVLATLAFVAWAIATVSVVAAEFNAADEAEQAFILLAAAFVIPLVHTGFEELAKSRKAR